MTGTIYRRRRKKRIQASSTARGYNYAHQQLRKRLLALWRPGDPCARCGQPMYGPPSMIHLGHTADRTGYIGLEHRFCNCSDGAKRGNAARSVDGRSRVTVVRSRVW